MRKLNIIDALFTRPEYALADIFMKKRVYRCFCSSPGWFGGSGWHKTLQSLSLNEKISDVRGKMFDLQNMGIESEKYVENKKSKTERNKQVKQAINKW